MVIFLVIIGYLFCGFIGHILLTIINKIDSGTEEKLDFALVAMSYIMGPFVFCLPLAWLAEKIAHKFKPIDTLVRRILEKKES